MSVWMTMKINADPDRFRQVAEANAETLVEVSEQAKGKGCLSHEFAVGDGFVMVIDRWESAEGFQSFFEGNEKVEQLMGEVGVQGEPEITIAEAIDTADRF